MSEQNHWDRRMSPTRRANDMEELSLIRERLARIETTLEHIADRVECAKTATGTAGSVVVPVAVVVMVVEILKELITRLG